MECWQCLSMVYSAFSVWTAVPFLIPSPLHLLPRLTSSMHLDCPSSSSAFFPRSSLSACKGCQTSLPLLGQREGWGGRRARSDLLSYFGPPRRLAVGLFAPEGFLLSLCKLLSRDCDILQANMKSQSPWYGDARSGTWSGTLAGTTATPLTATD